MATTSTPGARPHRRLGRLLNPLVTGLLAAFLVGASAGTAHAATGYQYWNYFHVQHGQYAFAKTGAGDYTPKNGSTEAYRYGTSTTSKGIPPRADLSRYDFATICQGTTATSRQKRVAVIIDYGTKADAPNGQTPPAPRTACAVVPQDATGQQVLDAVAQVRQHPYTCGIDGYPATGCSVTVKNAAESSGQPVSFTLPKAAQGAAAAGSSATGGPATGSSDGGTGPWPVVALAIVCIALAVGAYALNRRRSA